MDKHRSLASAVVLAVALCGASAVQAEVSAELDPTGNYVRTIVLSTASVKNVKIWSVQRVTRNYVPLNRRGDKNGDLWPAVAENPVTPDRPWVVWSRWNGDEYDIAWSRWFQTDWTPIRFLGQNMAGGDDLDPDVVFDFDGRPFLAWWRNEPGGGRVYLSLFLTSRWSDAFPISDDEVDSRYPEVSVQPDGSILIVFETPQGPVHRVIGFSRPDSITDDLNPFDSLSVLGGGPGDGEEFGQ